MNSLIKSGRTNAFGSSGLRKTRPCSERSASFDFLVDGEEQLFLEREQFFLARVLVKRKLGFIDRPALVRIFHHSQQLFVARLAEFDLEHQPPADFDIALLEFLDRLASQPVAKHVLLAHELFDQRFEFVVLMGRDRGRPADDERRARFVDQDRIDFIDNRVMITALDLLVARRGHAVVAQIIESELAVRSVSDVHRVLLAAHIRLLIVLNATDGQSEKIIELPHPFRVASRQIIVHRHQMGAATGQRI